MKLQEAWDALLSWCSEIGCASIDEFRASCRYLALRPGNAARVLSDLGHVEFDWNNGRFAGAPTTLTTIPGLPGRLLLVGARPYGLIARIADLADTGAFDFDVPRQMHGQLGKAPSTALIDGDPADAADFCQAAGIIWTETASENISRVLPQVRVDTATAAFQPDDRFPHTLIDPDSFEPRWDETPNDVAEGLWLYRIEGRRRQMVLRIGEDPPRQVLDPDYGPYLMARDEDADPIVEYHGPHRVLVVNAAAPLPTLQARCACLCSGRLPTRRDAAPGVAFHRYVNVDPDIADRILHSLGVTA